MKVVALLSLVLACGCITNDPPPIDAGVAWGNVRDGDSFETLSYTIAMPVDAASPVGNVVYNHMCCDQGAVTPQPCSLGAGIWTCSPEDWPGGFDCYEARICSMGTSCQGVGGPGVVVSCPDSGTGEPIKH